MAEIIYHSDDGRMDIELKPGEKVPMFVQFHKDGETWIVSKGFRLLPVANIARVIRWEREHNRNVSKRKRRNPI